MSDDAVFPWLEIPWQQLPVDTLERLIEEFVGREGTDYGLVEIPLARKIEQVRQQMLRGEVVIVFDTGSETVNLLTRRQFRELQQDAEG